MFKIRCLVSFSDFKIFPRVIKQGEELEVSQNVYDRLISSGGKFQKLALVIPISTVEEEPKKAKHGKA
jgi:hypothetical protein